VINEKIEFCERLAKDVGVDLKKLVEPAKELRRISVATNSAVGIGLIAVGALVSSKVLVAFGALGLVSATVMATSDSSDKSTS